MGLLCGRLVCCGVIHESSGAPPATAAAASTGRLNRHPSDASPVIHTTVQLTPITIAACTSVEHARSQILEFKPLTRDGIERECRMCLDASRPAPSDPDHKNWDIYYKTIANRIRMAHLGTKVGRKSLPFMLASGEMLRKFARTPTYLRCGKIVLHHLERIAGIVTPEWHEEIEKDTNGLVGRLMTEGRRLQGILEQVMARVNSNNAAAAEKADHPHATPSGIPVPIPLAADERRALEVIRHIGIILSPNKVVSAHDRPNCISIPGFGTIDPRKTEFVKQLDVGLGLIALQREIQNREDFVQISEELVLNSLGDRALSRSLTPSEDIRDLLESIFIYWRASWRLIGLYKAFDDLLLQSGKTFDDVVFLFEPVDETAIQNNLTVLVDTDQSFAPPELIQSDPPSVKPLKSILKKKTSFAVDFGDEEEEAEFLAGVGVGMTPTTAAAGGNANGNATTPINSPHDMLSANDGGLTGLGDRKMSLSASGVSPRRPAQPYWVADIYVSRGLEREEHLLDVQMYFMFELLLRGLRYPAASLVVPTNNLRPPPRVASSERVQFLDQPSPSTDIDGSADSTHTPYRPPTPKPKQEVSIEEPDEDADAVIEFHGDNIDNTDTNDTNTATEPETNITTIQA